jgi:eukaryotic-like serine/threonine-protein kinase
VTLTSGTRLGPYEVVAAIGAGGMGEVYRATDTNLGRQIAIKILPDAFAQDPERVARFEREAKTLASLNHPNIAIIHGLEKSSATYALVMELVEGEDLSQRIARGPIPIDEALPMAKQIAEALEAAHERGIVHRDLKPANIKIRADGTAKVLDFGLAKLNEPNPNVSNDPNALSLSPTITSPALMTGVGVLLGSAAYMSPEQARGRMVDKRSDIWAFGCVLYEMLTGKRAFEDEDVSMTLSKVLQRDPELEAFPVDVPSGVRQTIRLCLRKSQRDRIADIHDVRLALEGAFEAASRGTTPLPPAARGKREPLAWAAVGILLVAALALSFLLARRLPPTAPEMRVEITTPATSSPFHFALSPDGEKLAFVASSGAQPRLWVRALNAVAAQPLAGTENAEYLFWSPDGRSIGFFAGGKLKRVDVGGGPPQALADAPAGRGGAWNRNGTILFAASNAGPLSRVSASGGETAAVTRLGRGHASHRFPHFLSDGRHFLFFVQAGLETQGIYIGSLDGGEPKRLLANDTAAGWASGRLLFVRQGALMAAPLDPEKGELTGEPNTVADPVAFDNAFNLGGFSVSAEGRIAYRSGGSDIRTLAWYDRSGKAVGTVGGPDQNTPQYPELSPDGRRLAVTRPVQNNFDVWLIDLVRGGMTRFTFDAASDNAPLWSSDGTRIVFRSNRKGTYDLYAKPSSGAGSEHLIQESALGKGPLSWSSDGRFLLFYVLDPKTVLDLWIQPLTGDGSHHRG